MVWMVLTGCANDDLTWVSIKNETSAPIYVLPYSSEFANADWIQPGVSDDFYSISCDCIDGFSYFSFYYDSLIVFLNDHADEPIKFYKDGTTLNYDPALNPFINPDVWYTKDFEKAVKAASLNNYQEKHIVEHYFCINEESVRCPSHQDESDPGL